MVPSTSCLHVCDQARPPTHLHLQTQDLHKQSRTTSLKLSECPMAISGLLKDLLDSVGNLLSLCMCRVSPMSLKASWGQGLSHTCSTPLVNGVRRWVCECPVNTFQLNYGIKSGCFYFSWSYLLVINCTWRGLNCPTLNEKKKILIYNGNKYIMIEFIAITFIAVSFGLSLTFKSEVSLVLSTYITFT